MKTVCAPIFRDPIFDGAADPMVIYNRTTGTWQMFYTQRRANVESPGVAYCYGCAVGVAETIDGGNSWYYIGNLDLEFERGHNTFWAPEIMEWGGVYHMYVTYIRGVRFRFSGEARILHYTSDDLWDWTLQGPVSLDTDASVIDACTFPLPGGGVRLWYKHEGDHSHIYAADSMDGATWKSVGPVITDTSGEGPNVFELNGQYFMIVDVWDGQAVYRSKDLKNWERQAENILKLPGRRPEDGSIGLHADVVTHKGRGYIIYFTHPERTGDFRTLVNEGLPYGSVPYRYRRTSVQAAELTVANGWIACDRDRAFTMELD